MADDVDIAQERQQGIADAQINHIRQHAYIKPGVEGDCDFCGEHTMRLINGSCAPCRDRYKLD